MEKRSDYGRYANADTMERYMEELPARNSLSGAQVLPGKGNAPCRHSCAERATHQGMVNGLMMTMGCEAHVKQWVERRNS